MSNRVDREREHGARLNHGDPDPLWGWKTAAGERRAARRADLLASGAGLRTGLRVLEVGCGTGLFTERFAATGADVTAIDVSEDLLLRARSRLPGFRFVLGDFAITDVGGPFDAVMGSSVLHHLPVSAALARMFTLLKPGGRLAFAEPNFLNPQVFLERKLRFLPYYAAYTSPDETAFVRWRLASALGIAGYRDIQITPFDWLHPSTPASLLDAISRLGRVVEKVPLIRECAGSLLIVATRPV